MKGYCINHQLIVLQEQIDARMLRIEDTQSKQQQQLDFFIRTNTPPAEMVFFNGEFFTARVAIENLIKTRLRDEHNRQANIQPVEVFKWRNEPHDRFLIIDDRLYHCGHSLNATGGKLSAIMLMGTSPEVILSEM